jgi:cobyrinic acid a,c-diamide synthase
MMKGLLVAGTQSGIGKTTITLAILKALKDSGYRVQSYKVGPDFIDPTHLEKVTNAPCYNLDSYMMGEDGINRELAKCDADYAVIEGAMGLYDGISSSAKIAAMLKVPVILVIDAQASSESVAAQALGFIKYSSFTPSKLTIAGVIANRVGSQKHAESINHALAAINIPLIGTVRTDVEGIPTRHLGLYMGSETSLTTRALKLINADHGGAAAAGVEQHKRYTDRDRIRRRILLLLSFKHRIDTKTCTSGIFFSDSRRAAGCRWVVLRRRLSRTLYYTIER